MFEVVGPCGPTASLLLRKKGGATYGCTALFISLEARVVREGIEPPTQGFSVLCSTD